MSQQQMQEGLAAAQKLLLASRAQHSAEMAALKQQLVAAQQSSQQNAQQGATASAELEQAKKVAASKGWPICLPVPLRVQSNTVLAGQQVSVSIKAAMMIKVQLSS